MNQQLNEIVSRLRDAKQHRGRLTQIAAESGVSYRTIYTIMLGCVPSVTTSDKLAAYFTKLDRKAKKEKSA